MSPFWFFLGHDPMTTLSLFEAAAYSAASMFVLSGHKANLASIIYASLALSRIVAVAFHSGLLR
jgi:hypothetical protein